MTQLTKFPAIPNIDPPAYVDAVNRILEEIRDAKPSPKGLREFLRMQNLFDKPTHGALMEFMDVITDKTSVSLGPFARQVLDSENEPSLRRLLAGRLLDRNLLMAKYCLEALDTEQGGRLHSTNELFRMLTSYVYPGEKPDLPSFKAWIDWAVSAGLVRLVGIRWALGTVGVESIPRLRAIDVEEFLEEESGLDEEPETSAEPEPAAVPDVKPAEPPPGPAVRESGPVDRPEKEAARDALVEAYSRDPSRIPLSLDGLGIDPRAETSSFLFEAAFAALLLARGLPPAVVRTVLDAFRERAVLATVNGGRFPVDAIQQTIKENSTAAFSLACEASIHLPRLTSAAGNPSDLVRAPDPGGLLWALWKRLYEPAGPLAPFYLARLLHLAGYLPADRSVAAFIPSCVVRENAFRIGFTHRMHAGGFGVLVDIVLELGALFPAPDFEGPVAWAHEGLGCRFRCDRTRTCTVPCREKTEIGRFDPVAGWE